MKKLTLIFYFSFLILHSNAQSPCPLTKENTLWYGTLQLNDTVKLNFNFRWLTKSTQTAYGKRHEIEIYNGTEVIVVDQVIMKGNKQNYSRDSIIAIMPLFDSEFRCKIIDDKTISGVWINRARQEKNSLPFSAEKKTIKPVSMLVSSSFAGKWETHFNVGTNKAYNAIGLFSIANCWDKIYGTFLTETGDYRYLSGNVNNQDSTMELSCFDGSHAFLFKAKLNANGKMDGHFYSGAHGYEQWEAIKNEQYDLRNADSLTYLKPSFSKIDFTFPDLIGKNISLTDSAFKNKVVIVQIMGSWCPNCIDETKYLNTLYNTKKNKGLEIIALAYERTKDMPKAIANVDRLKKRLNFNYTTLIAATSSDKNEAAKTLPMINHILSYPTTIYIDKKGVVRKIYTGFNGPATGAYYTTFVNETEAFINKLLAE